MSLFNSKYVVSSFRHDSMTFNVQDAGGKLKHVTFFVKRKHVT